MRKIALLCLASVLLTSCVGIDSRLTIRDNGSGVLSLSYRVAQVATDLGVATSGSRAIPLPVSRDDFDRSLKASNGKVRLTSFSRSENEKDITIRAELAFDSLDSLASLDAFKDAELRVSTEGSKQTLSQLIARAPEEPLNDETKQMIDTLFKGYDISFTVEAPRPIVSSTLGTLSTDKRVLTYKASVRDVLTTTNDLVLSLSW
ncbi:MAG TPA: hypothetical protein VHE79_00995 [Spirochaetia bacterium]